MASKDLSVGTAGTLRLVANEGDLDANGNVSDVSWAFYLIERTSSPLTHAEDVTGRVQVGGGSAEYDGTFDFSWAGSGLQTKLIASGTTPVIHLPDGTMTIGIAATMGPTGTSGAGGGATVTLSLPLTTLTVVPGTPTGLTAARVSDTQVSLAWSQSSATNGQPTTNTVQRRINAGAWTDVATIAPATSTSVDAAANQKIEYRVRGNNAAGSSAWSSTSTPVYTTPAVPTSVAAAKDVSGNINVTWVPHVAFTEHQHVIEHGTVTGGVTTWDGSPLATIAAGTSTYQHATPDPTKVHVYRVYAKNTAVGALTSAKVLSNQVQLLVAPNAPTVPVLPAYADKAKDFTLTWAHNSVDTTPQKYYEVGYSTNGGSSWSTTGKITSTVASKLFAANTYAANTALMLRVRTWGSATSGGADGTGASAWSTPQTVTFKTRPVATILSPANSSTWTEAALAVGLGFSQAESASFVRATIVLKHGATVLETLDSTTLASTPMATEVENGLSYSLTVTVLDSNGLVSDPVVSSFSVAYTLPVVAGVSVLYLPESGVAQLELTFPAPGVGEVDAAAVTIIRTIDGVAEAVVTAYPVTDDTLTILDMTPTIFGTNHYQVRTISGDGATVDATIDLTTAEEYLAFLSTGAGFATIVTFWGNLGYTASPARSTSLVRGAGRQKPIALFGDATALEVVVKVTLVPELGSSRQEIEAFLKSAGIVCYRDPSGRRMFGTVEGSYDAPSSLSADLQFKVTEAT